MGVVLNLTEVGWKQEIIDHPDLSAMVKEKIISAMVSFTVCCFPPICTASLIRNEFEQIEREIDKIVYNDKELFITAELISDLKIRVTDELSRNWSHRHKKFPTEEDNEGWPKYSLFSVYLIQLVNSKCLYARVDYEHQTESGGKVWLAFEHGSVGKHMVIAWMRIC